MSAAAPGGPGAHREARRRARLSRRPSRLGTAAGSAPRPDRVFADDAGFPGLLARVWKRAVAAPTLAECVDILLTLDGHVPADVQLRALRTSEGCALEVLCGVSWRGRGRSEPSTGGQTAFLGEIGLTTGGRIAVRVPSQRALAEEEDLVDGTLRVPWSAAVLARYRDGMMHAAQQESAAVAECRGWLAASGTDGRDLLLDELKDAAMRTAPFILYQDGKRYTNFRERNNLVGKTLWPGHPDCAFSSLQGVPLELWSDNDVVLVVCLILLIRSGGYGRIEEANGTQLTLGHVAALLEQTRLRYNAASPAEPVPAAAVTVAAQYDLATRLAARRRDIVSRVQLYREIHGPLMHKVERVAAPLGQTAARREQEICSRLRQRLPLTGNTLNELADSAVAAPGWLAEPAGGFGTGLESLIYEAVAAARAAFAADFAMSRGMRSLSTLIAALRAGDWPRIAQWELPEFFCCVVPDPAARKHFAGSAAALADVAWAMSARMQYNSWHFIAGNLPKTPEVAARDYFVPPAIPDIAYYSDQHHHGHVAARVRFSIRSPQPVEILGHSFGGFVDLRLLRCEWPPFGEQDLLAAHRTSALIARATTAAAAECARGAALDVRAFDSAWHWATIAGEER
ncbi:MAG TPA: hypothetical protein VFO77_09450 [Actinoplanes sp.]|nr:hypothetical protein [Actinoplanes sp.]